MPGPISRMITVCCTLEPRTSLNPASYPHNIAKYGFHCVDEDLNLIVKVVGYSHYIYATIVLVGVRIIF